MRMYSPLVGCSSFQTSRGSCTRVCDGSSRTEKNGAVCVWPIPFCPQRARRGAHTIGDEGQSDSDEPERDSPEWTQQKPFAHRETEHDSSLQGTHPATGFGYADNTSAKRDCPASGLRRNSKPVQ